MVTLTFHLQEDFFHYDVLIGTKVTVRTAGGQ